MVPQDVILVQFGLLEMEVQYLCLQLGMLLAWLASVGVQWDALILQFKMSLTMLFASECSSVFVLWNE